MERTDRSFKGGTSSGSRTNGAKTFVGRTRVWVERKCQQHLCTVESHRQTGAHHNDLQQGGHGDDWLFSRVPFKHVGPVRANRTAEIPIVEGGQTGNASSSLSNI